MINILEDIEKTLSPLGLEVYFITRGNNPPPCIVVNYTQSDGDYYDNSIEDIEILFNLNIILGSNIEDTKVKISQLLRENKYKEIKIIPSLQESEGIFNTPIKTKKIFNVRRRDI